MAYTRVKICGITRPEDARAAVACGADAIGLVFYPASPRAVTEQQALEIAAALPPFVTLVALVVDEPKAGIERILSRVPVSLLQFHGEESPEFCRSFHRPYVRALRMRPGIDLVAECGRYPDARGLLLDNWQEGVPGGTGNAFDWQLVPGELPASIVLAGGLNAENVGQAIATLAPDAVDVSGGVEVAPGIKDPRKIARFIAAVRIADQQS